MITDEQLSAFCRAVDEKLLLNTAKGMGKVKARMTML